MFVQYSFVAEREYPGFKDDPVRLGDWSAVLVGLFAMAITTAVFLAL